MDEIETNFNSVITTNPEFEYENIIEFELRDYCSLIYSITNNNWRTWYIDNDGEEYENEFTIEEYSALESLTINGTTVDKEQLLEFLGIVRKQ